jgi:thiol-disulfide isomerase/thioredoxin
MTRRTRPALVAVVSTVAAVTAALVLAGCTTPIGAGSSTADQGFVGGDYAVTTWAPDDRAAAPAVRAKTLDGGSFSLASYHGKVVVLNFWASWCAPCRVETPALQVLAEEMASQGVVFVGVDSRDDPDAARAFLADIKGGTAPTTYPNLDDSSGEVILAFHGVVPDGFPSTIVLDRQGRVAARVNGPTTEPRLKALLQPLVGP